ncbi:ISCpe2, transposase OrfB [Exiguobacterium sp. S17]|nr:ISCpe2, transposase OrfB [Exiguobacterium sp. S17]
MVETLKPREMMQDRRLAKSIGDAGWGENDGKKDLHVREWTCGACGAHHERDVNASLNLLGLAD